MRTTIFLTLAMLAAIGACASPSDNDDPAAEVGTMGALAALDITEQRRFQIGRGEFMEIEAVSEGLGPLFNGSSCAQCHNLPGVGGGGISTVLRAGCLDGTGVFHEPPGGSLILLFSIRPDIGSATVPTGCSQVERRRTTSLLGAGLIEAIADADIVAQAEAPRAPGVRGRVAWIEEEGQRRVGRFGWKAQHVSLRVFAGDAYRNEMGITNALFPEENAPGGDQNMLNLMDWIKDPEARAGVIDSLADFMRFLAPTAPGPGATEEGAQVFAGSGCADCHRPSYLTPPNPSAVLGGKEVRLYSDLLLHDVGTGSVVPQAAAAAAELRTPPLWGVATQPVLLHDGRAFSLDEAIRAHAGEATWSREAYERLSASDRATLIDFLRSL